MGAETVLRDIERLAGMGARHITFGDPDFLNGWRHTLAIVRAPHEQSARHDWGDQHEPVVVGGGTVARPDSERS